MLLYGSHRKKSRYKKTAPQRSAAGRFLSAGPVGLGLSLIEVKEAAIYPNASMVGGHVPGISLQVLDRDSRHVDIRSVSVKVLTVLAGVFQRAVVGHRAVAAVDNEGNLPSPCRALGWPDTGWTPDPREAAHGSEPRHCHHGSETLSLGNEESGTCPHQRPESRP